MGGRKSYSSKNVLGSTRSSRKEKKQLVEAIESENPKKIVQSTLGLFEKSDKALDVLSNASYMFDFFEEQKGERFDQRKTKKDATKFWSKVKQDKKLKSSKEVDRIIVDSTAKSLRKKLGRGKND